MKAICVAALALCASLLVSSSLFAASAENDVKAAYSAWDAAFNKGDAKAVAAFYTSDALLLPPTHELIKGPAGVEKFFAGLFTNGITAHKLELIEAIASGDNIVGAAKWSVKLKDGKEGGGIATHVFQKSGGSLKLKLHTFN
jgi:ketosteroid isomerase-like protein